MVARRRRLESRPLLAAPPGPAYESHVVFPRALTGRECEAVIVAGTSGASGVGALQDGGAHTSDASLRRADIAWLAPDGELSWLTDRLAGLAERANATYGFDLTGFTEDLQFTTYQEPGAFYTWHQDGLDGEVAVRKLSIVVQLSASTDYTGSDLELLDVVEDAREPERSAWRRGVRRRGTAVVFPAFEYHQVTPLLAGRRHSLVCWIGGPPFR